MLKKFVAIVTLALGLGTSAIFGAATASAAVPDASVANVDTAVPGTDDDGSACRHSWKKCAPTDSGSDIIRMAPVTR